MVAASRYPSQVLFGARAAAAYKKHVTYYLMLSDGCEGGPHLVLVSEAHGLQLLCPLLGERLRGEGEVVGLREGAQVEVVLGVHRRRHVDVELQHLKELPLQLVPKMLALLFHYQVRCCAVLATKLF